MAFAIEGFSTVAQNHISRQVASNFYTKSPFLAILGALSLGNQGRTSLEIGRPGSGEILSGGMVTPIQRKQLGSVNSYLPRIQRFKTSNTKAMGVRDTYPVVANPTVNSHGQATQFAAKFNWTDIVTPILIWHEDKVRAERSSGTKEGQALSMGQVVDEATEIAYQEHVDWLVDKLINGDPSDQTADLWDEPAGLLTAASATNTYANVDRTVESTWQAHVDATLKAVDIKQIIDKANLDHELNTKGNGANLILCGITLYKQFKSQMTAQNGVVLKDGLPEMAKLGVKKEVLQIDNAYVCYEPGITNANTVIATDTTSWKFMVHPDRNFAVSKFIDLSETGEGGKDADQAFVRTRMMLTNDNPFLTVKYTAIGT